MVHIGYCTYESTTVSVEATENNLIDELHPMPSVALSQSASIVLGFAGTLEPRRRRPGSSHGSQSVTRAWPFLPNRGFCDYAHPGRQEASRVAGVRCGFVFSGPMRYESQKNESLHFPPFALLMIRRHWPHAEDDRAGRCRPPLSPGTLGRWARRPGGLRVQITSLCFVPCDHDTAEQLR